MNEKQDAYFIIALGSKPDDVRHLLGEPGLITRRNGDQQWIYEGGRFVLTFAGSGPQLIRVARRPDSGALPTLGYSIAPAQSTPSASSSLSQSARSIPSNMKNNEIEGNKE